MRTETTVRHTKCGRMRGMVVGEGGRSSGVLLYSQLCLESLTAKVNMLNYTTTVMKIP